jgi:hypothetical protein
MRLRIDILRVSICVLLLSACVGRSQKEYGTVAGEGQRAVDSIEATGGCLITALLDSGFVVNPTEYSLRYTRDETFTDKVIPVTVYATIDAAMGEGYLDSLVFTYEHSRQKISINRDDLLLLDPFWLKWADFMRLDDFNFDNHPDVVILDRALSGVQNRIHRIFIYSPERKQYLYHRELSEMPVSADKATKTIRSFWTSGVNRSISGEYRWDEGKLTLICSIEDDFDDSLEVVIRESGRLHNGAWVTRVDTLR